MNDTVLPEYIQEDIDVTFCFREDSSYQERSHEYLERYEVNRGYRDTAVQAVVTDIARRAFEAGAQGCAGGGRPQSHRSRTARNFGEVYAGSYPDRSAVMSNELKPCIHAEVCVNAWFCELEFGKPCNHYRAERTCQAKPVIGGGWFCSHCGVFVDRHPMANATDRLEARYCPNCGAKVSKS